MFVVDISVASMRHQTDPICAEVDTGFTGGLWLPRNIADDLKATMVPPVRYPRTIDGRVIRGRATCLRVRLVGGPRKRGREVPVFCPTHATRAVLLGAYFLALSNATLTIDGLEVEAPAVLRVNPMPDHDFFDFGDWVLPTDRAVTPWW